jgi:hypothetical protein
MLLLSAAPYQLRKSERSRIELASIRQRKVDPFTSRLSALLFHEVWGSDRTYIILNRDL